MGNSFVGMRNDTQYDTYVSFEKPIRYGIKLRTSWLAKDARCDIQEKYLSYDPMVFTLMVKNDRDTKATSDMGSLVTARVGKLFTSDGFVKLRPGETFNWDKPIPFEFERTPTKVYMYQIRQVFVDDVDSTWEAKYDVGSVRLYEAQYQSNGHHQLDHAGNHHVSMLAPSPKQGVEIVRETDNVSRHQSQFKLVADLDIVDQDASRFSIKNESDHVTFVSISAAEDLGPAAQLLEALEAAGDNVNAANWTKSCNELLEAIGLDFGEVLRHDQDDGLYDLDASFTEDGAILATVKTVSDGISDVATIKEEIKNEVAEHLKEHGFTKLQPGKDKWSPAKALSSVHYAHIWQIRETADGKLELYTCGRKMTSSARDDYTNNYVLDITKGYNIFNFKLLGQISVEDASLEHAAAKAAAEAEAARVAAEEAARLAAIAAEEAAAARKKAAADAKAAEEARRGPWHLRILRPLLAGTDRDMHHLHLNSLEVYDQTGAKLSLTYSGNASEYVKRGHGDPALTPANAIDGNLNSLSHNDYSGNAKYGSQGHWMEFDIAETSVLGSGTPTTAVISNKHRPERLAGASLFLSSFRSEGMASSPILTQMQRLAAPALAGPALILTGEVNQTVKLA